MLALRGASSGFECPKRGKLATLMIEKKWKEGERRIALMMLLRVIQTNMREQPCGRMYMAKELADETNLPYKKEKGYVKRVNAMSLPIYGVV